MSREGYMKCMEGLTDKQMLAQVSLNSGTIGASEAAGFLHDRLVKARAEVSPLTAERDAINRKLEQTISIWKNQVSALTAECDGLKRELEVAQADCVVLGKMAKAGDELAQYASYAEIVGKINHNRSSIRTWCDAVFEISRGVDIDSNPGAPLIAELTKLREAVKAGDNLESLMLQMLDSIENPDRMSGVLVGKAEESLAAYLAAKSALEVKG